VRQLPVGLSCYRGCEAVCSSRRARLRRWRGRRCERRRLHARSGARARAHLRARSRPACARGLDHRGDAAARRYATHAAALSAATQGQARGVVRAGQWRRSGEVGLAADSDARAAARGCVEVHEADRGAGGAGRVSIPRLLPVAWRARSGIGDRGSAERGLFPARAAARPARAIDHGRVGAREAERQPLRGGDPECGRERYRAVRDPVHAGRRAAGANRHGAGPCGALEGDQELHRSGVQQRGGDDRDGRSGGQGRRLQPVEQLEDRGLSRRLADSHRPVRDAAHHHALEHGLAAERRVSRRGQPPFRPPLAQRRTALAQAPAAVRAVRRPLATRRWKRSTRPPVSTSFWRPV